LTRSIDRIVHALFALNRRYRVNDKTALDELVECPRLPPRFASRVRSVFSRLGESQEELLGAVERIRALARETAALEPELLAIGKHSPAWLRLQEQAGMV
ncbi:MAG TPA: hypothetical protein VG963_03715, partial [Polyangiaceae bacterium]|nr:hypothetical protein [Polyangiaceae bacterium]